MFVEYLYMLKKLVSVDRIISRSLFCHSQESQQVILRQNKINGQWECNLMKYIGEPINYN